MTFEKINDNPVITTDDRSQATTYNTRVLTGQAQTQDATDTITK